MQIADVKCEPLSLSLTEAFGIAGGSQPRAENVLVQVRLLDGSLGLGEAAPFPAFNGDTQAAALASVRDVADSLCGRDATHIREIASLLKLDCPSPSARAAVEMACLDAEARRAGESLWHRFGAACPELCTDITVVTGTPEHAAASTRRAVADGFERIKVKVGGAAAETDAARLAAVFDAAPEADFILDANASLSAQAAIELLRSLGSDVTRVALFEQPTPKEDLAGLAQVRRAGVRVAADESVTSRQQLPQLLEAVDVVNIKLMKSGVIDAWDLAIDARDHGMSLMIGGLVESDLSMTVSACLAAGVGGFEFVDLDTALFVKDPPFVGGVQRAGPLLRVDQIAAGHGVSLGQARALRGFAQ